jgi:hypothetical protein
VIKSGRIIWMGMQNEWTRREIKMKFLPENLQVWGCFRDLGLGERILKWILLKKKDIRV